MGGSKQDREAEWYRRKRADRDRIPLPQEFRLFDDEEAISVRFPVTLVAPLFRPIFSHGNPWWSHSGGGTAILFLMLLVLVGMMFFDPFLVLILSVMFAVPAVPLLLLGLLRRTVTVRAEGVEVGWWPIPFLARRLVFREIAQAFVVRRGPPVVGGFPGDPDTGPAPEFEVWIVRRNGVRERLVASMRSADHALYLERWLERRLGIEDAPVAGEFS